MTKSSDSQSDFFKSTREKILKSSNLEDLVKLSEKIENLPEQDDQKHLEEIAKIKGLIIGKELEISKSSTKSKEENKQNTNDPKSSILSDEKEDSLAEKLLKEQEEKSRKAKEALIAQQEQDAEEQKKKDQQIKLEEKNKVGKSFLEKVNLGNAGIIGAEIVATATLTALFPPSILITLPILLYSAASLDVVKKDDEIDGEEKNKIEGNKTVSEISNIEKRLSKLTNANILNPQLPKDTAEEVLNQNSKLNEEASKTQEIKSEDTKQILETKNSNLKEEDQASKIIKEESIKNSNSENADPKKENAGKKEDLVGIDPNSVFNDELNKSPDLNSNKTVEELVNDMKNAIGFGDSNYESADPKSLPSNPKNNRSQEI